MTIKRFFVTGILCILAIEAANLQSVVIGSVAPPTTQLNLVTTVEGKTFYADWTVARNWTAAGDYCRSMNMTLASITTAAQVNALKSAYKEEFFGAYWTSGRDAQTWRQFSWNETNVEVDYPFPVASISTAPLTCMAIEYTSNTILPIYVTPCTNTTGTFCETSNKK